jgi:predicted GTPase
VKELVRYLLENLYLDFSGDISVDKVREFLREDDSASARRLLARIIEDKGVDDVLLALADVLKEHLRTGIDERVVAEQLSLYSDS